MNERFFWLFVCFKAGKLSIAKPYMKSAIEEEDRFIIKENIKNNKI